MMPVRLRIFLIHLSLSALLVGSCVAFVLLIWYPGGLAKLDGIADILFVMVGVDVAAGPLCTLVAAAPGKSRQELRRDLTVIGCIQLLALGYALVTSAIARPAFVVYSFGQFEIERASQLRPELAAKASDPAYAHAPWLGPIYVESRLPPDKATADAIITSTMNGLDALKDMPQYYAAWPGDGSAARKKARTVESLWEKGTLRPAVEAMLRRAGLAEGDGLVLPIIGQVARGTVVARKSDLAILGIIPGQAP